MPTLQATRTTNQPSTFPNLGQKATLREQPSTFPNLGQKATLREQPSTFLTLQKSIANKIVSISSRDNPP
ncbi:hypothetical protein [Moorena sp. SIO3I8]|uniref:hypothetical protein n=1 Tax=Moorena sp. SIO3I8 TaxID=2607833 RepID=UPI0025CEA0C0|nr:hypothetical protein [Moorena sp. SIO3I8]